MTSPVQIWDMRFLAIFAFLSVAAASNLLSLVTDLEKGNREKSHVADRFTAQLKKNSPCNFKAIERFAEFLIKENEVFADGSNELVFVQTLSSRLAAIPLNECSRLNERMFFTGLLFVASGRETPDFDDYPSASKIALLSLRDPISRAAFIKRSAEFIAHDLNAFFLPLEVFETGFLPPAERLDAFKFYSEKLLEALPATGPFPLNHIYMFSWHCLYHGVMLPSAYWETFCTVIQRNDEGLRLLPLYQLTGSLESFLGKLKSEQEEQLVAVAFINLFVNDSVLSSIKQEFIEKFASVFAILVSKAPEHYKNRSNSVVQQTEIFQQINNLRVAITKLSKVNSLIKACGNNSQSDFNTICSCMDIMERMRPEFASKYTDFRARLINVLFKLVTVNRTYNLDGESVIVEQKIVILIRASLMLCDLFPFPSRAYSASTGRVMFAMGTLLAIKNPSTELARTYIGRINDQYIEECFQKSLSAYEEIKDSLFAQLSCSHYISQFIRRHSNPVLRRKMINRLFIRLISCSRLVQVENLEEPVYQIAVKFPEVNVHSLMTLFLDFFLEYQTDPNGLTKENMNSFANFLLNQKSLNHTEKVLISRLNSQIN